MAVGVIIRPARPADAADMARVLVASWRETYRGLMPDEVLDDPGFIAARERFWTAALTDPLYAQNRIAVAEQGKELIGVAMSGPPLDADASRPVQLYVLYVYAAHHGSGTGATLLDAVVDPNEAASLWVTDPNPRAQAFYPSTDSSRTALCRSTRASVRSGWSGEGSFIGAVRPESALNARVISLGHEWWAPAFASPLSEASIGNDGPNHG